MSLGSLYLGRDLLVVCKYLKLELNIRIILNILNFSCEKICFSIKGTAKMFL